MNNEQQNHNKEERRLISCKELYNFVCEQRKKERESFWNLKREQIIKEIDKDLDLGKFGSICSNETTFVNYITKLLKEL